MTGQPECAEKRQQGLTEKYISSSGRNSKSWQMGLHEIKKLLQAKETIDKAKKQFTNWEKTTLQSNVIIKDLECALQQLQNIYFVHKYLEL